MSRKNGCSGYSRRAARLLGMLVVVALVASTGCDRDASPDDEEPSAAIEADRQQANAPAKDSIDNEVAFPRNQWECTDEARADVDRWFEEMSRHYDGVPWRWACEDAPEYRPRIDEDGYRRPTGVDRTDELARLIASEEFVGLPVPRPFQYPEVLETRQRMGAIDGEMIRLKSRQISSGLESAHQARMDPPKGIVLALPPELKFEHAALLLSIVSELEFFADRQLRIAVETVAEDDSAAPGGVEAIPDSVRQRIYETFGQPCSVDDPISFEEFLDDFNAGQQERVEGCEYRVIGSHGMGLPLARIQQLNSAGEAQTLEPGELAGFWQGCGCEPDIETLAALLYLKVGMEDVRPLSMLEFIISDQGTSIEFSPDHTWQEVVDDLQQYHGEAVALKLPELPGQPGGVRAQPEVVLDTPVVDGDGLDEEIIIRVVRQHRRELLSCYERALQATPALPDRATLRWTISSDGTTGDISVDESTQGHPVLAQCLRQTVNRWRFPPPDDGMRQTVDFPVEFVRQ